MKNHDSTLFGLWLSLDRQGILNRAIKHSLSKDYIRMVIYYYDRNLNETFMTIFRSSRLCYYLSIDNQKITFRRQKDIITWLSEFFDEYAEWVDYMNYIKSSKMLENRFLHSKLKIRQQDYSNWIIKRRAEIYGSDISVSSSDKIDKKFKT